MSTLESGLFSDCSNLKTVKLPKNLTLVPVYLFENCSALTQVELPKSVKSMEIGAFYGCSALARIEIPAGVTAIGERAFWGCSALPGVVLPDSVTSVDFSAFEGCASLKSVTLSKALSVIPYACFKGCGLESLAIPEGVTTIEEDAFAYCGALREAKLPKTVERIEGNPFRECGSLEAVTAAAGNKQYRAEDGVLFTADGSTLVCYPNGKSGDYTVPDSVTGLGQTAFAGCRGLTGVTLPPELTAIDSGAFYNCCQLKSVVLPQGLTSIGTEAFAQCGELEHINIPASVTEMGDRVLEDCVMLKTAGPIGGGYHIEFGWTKAIPAQAFDTATGLESVTLPQTLTKIGDYAFYACVSLAELQIPGRVKTIGKLAFCQCRSLRSLALPDSVESIGESICGSCSALESVTLPKKITEIPDESVYDCRELRAIRLPAGVTAIGRQALENCAGLTEITLPGGLSSLGDNAFYGCSGLSSVELPKGLTSIGSGAFSLCSGLKQIVIPEGVRELKASVFRGCSGLQYVSLPASVTSVDIHAFAECDRLKTVGPAGGGYDVEYAWTAIPELAFAQCRSLTTLVVSKNVTQIGEAAFTGCSGLTEIVFLGAAPTIGDKSFTEVTATAYYPENEESWTSSARKDYGGTLTWKPLSSRIGRPALSCSAQANGVELRWGAIQGADRYQVQRQFGAEAWKTLGSTDGLAYTDPAPAMGTNQYRVRARVNGLWGDYSEAAAAFFNPFADIPSEGKTFVCAAWAYNSGIVKGSGDRFSPNAGCTRLQVILMLWKMAGSPGMQGTNPYADVSGTKSVNAVLWALEQGIIVPAEVLNANETISRVQLVMMLWKAEGCPKTSGSDPFRDVSGSKTRSAVRWAYQNGITKGTGEGRFSPNARCSKIQIVFMLYAYYNNVRPHA